MSMYSDGTETSEQRQSPDRQRAVRSLSECERRRREIIASTSVGFHVLADRLPKLVRIARLLAESESPHDHEFGDCALCGVRTEPDGYDPVEPKHHAEDCPWRLARELYPSSKTTT